jgi:hypothetical protein
MENPKGDEIWRRGKKQRASESKGRGRRRTRG